MEYESHLNPEEDQSPYYEPCPDCEGTGRGPHLYPRFHRVDCESCDGKGEIKIEP